MHSQSFFSAANDSGDRWPSASLPWIFFGDFIKFYPGLSRVGALDGHNSSGPVYLGDLGSLASHVTFIKFELGLDGMGHRGNLGPVVALCSHDYLPVEQSV